MSPESTVNFNDPRFTPFFREQEYALLMDTEERTNFFTDALRKKYMHLDISSLNERAYEQIGTKYDIYEGFNLKDPKHLRTTELDDVYLHIANLKDLSTDGKDSRPVLFLKVNLYSGNMSFVILTADFDINELEPSDIVNTRDLIDDFDGPEDDLYSYLRERAIDKLKESSDYIWLGGLEVVAEVNTKYLFEGLIDEKSKDALIKNLMKNTPDTTLEALKLPHVDNYRDCLNALREGAIEDLQFGYLYRLFERNRTDFSYLVDDLKQIMEREAKIMNKNNFTLSRNDDGKYVVTGTFIGTAGELSKTLRQLNEKVQEMEFKPRRQIVAEFSKDMTDAVVILVRGGIETVDTYEVGIELPMDFASLSKVDEGKVCDLVGINGVPVFVDTMASKEYGNLAGKPALFVMATNKATEKYVIDWAHECAEKMSNFDFAEYCIMNNGYDGLLRDGPTPTPPGPTSPQPASDYMQMEGMDEDPGIEDDLPIEV